ncbi:MAG: hypothetical protein KGZ82_09425 [Bacteroidales bacterium]|nr:hypothetical protein [Bacteroidales bacterium]
MRTKTIFLVMVAVMLLMTGTGMGQTTYTWNNAAGGVWTNASNWTPARSVAAATDVLKFTDGGTYTVTGVPAETIAQLEVSGNTHIILQAGTASNTLTVGGDSGNDLVIGSGSELNFTGSLALQLSLLTGTTASISGSMAFQEAAHKLLCADAAGVSFETGSVFTAGTGMTGNAFGTTSLNSVVFKSGSVYVHNAGGNPFGASQPNSVVVFQTASLFRLQTGSVAFTGRTYADFEYNNNGSCSASGTSAVVIDNMTITQGVFNMNMTGTPGHRIKGNITVASGASLNFSPSSAGTINLDGTSQQTISGAGSITAGSNSGITTANASGVVINTAVSLNNFSITAGYVSVLPNCSLILSGTLSNGVGTTGLQLLSDATGTASLQHITADVQGSVQRYLTKYNSASDRMYHFVASPVAAQPIQTEFVANPPLAAADFYAYDELQNIWVNTKQANGSWNPAFETNFAVGKGYLVAYPDISTKTFSGALNNGDYVVSCSHTVGKGNGWNLIGNPYPSAVDWNLLSLGDGIDNALYYYDAAAENYRYYLQLPGESGSIGSGQQYIPAMQGIMVHAKTSGTKTITFTNAARTASGQNVYYNSQAAPTGSISLKVVSGTYADETFVHFNAGATAAFDGDYDAYKLFSYNTDIPQLYTLTEEEAMLAVNGQEPLQAESQLVLYLRPGATSAHTITASVAQLQASILLTDLKTGVTTKLSDETVYGFEANGSDAAARFLLQFAAVGLDESRAVRPVVAFMAGDELVVRHPRQPASIMVFDISGRLLLNSQASAGELSRLPFAPGPGLYVVSLLSEEGMQSTKLIVPSL